jgi:hypothetical protein
LGYLLADGQRLDLLAEPVIEIVNRLGTLLESGFPSLRVDRRSEV